MNMNPIINRRGVNSFASGTRRIAPAT